MKIPSSPLLITLALSSTALAAPTPEQPSSRPLLTPLLASKNEGEPSSPSLSVNSPLLVSVKGDVNLDAEVWGLRPRQMPGNLMRRWQKRQVSNPASGLSAESIASTASNPALNVNGAISTLGQSASGLTSALGGLGLGSTVGSLTANPLGAVGGLASNPLGTVGGLLGSASGAVGGVTGLLPLSGVTGLTGGLLGSTAGVGGLLGSTNGILGSATGLLGSATGGLTGSSSGLLGGLGIGQTVGGVIGTVSGLPVVGGLAGGALGSVQGVVTNLQAANGLPSLSTGSNPLTGYNGAQSIGILSNGVGGTAQGLGTAQALANADSVSAPQAGSININQVPGLVANLGGGKYLLSSGQVVVASATGIVEGILPSSAVQGLLGGAGGVLGNGEASGVNVGGLASSVQGGLSGLQGSLAGVEGQLRYVNIGGQVVSLNSAGQIVGILQSQPSVSALESQAGPGAIASQSGLGQTVSAPSNDIGPAAPVVPNGYSNIGQAQLAGLAPINYYDVPFNSTLPDMGNSTMPTNMTGFDNSTMPGNMTSSDNVTTANMDNSSNPLSAFEYNSTSNALLPSAYTANDAYDPNAYSVGSDDTAPSNQSLQDNEGTDATSLVAQAMSGGEPAAQPMVTGLSADASNSSLSEASNHRTYENVPWRRPAHPVAPVVTTTAEVVVTATATMTSTETVMATATVTDSVTATASVTASATDAGWGDDQAWGGWVTGTATGNWAQSTSGM